MSTLHVMPLPTAPTAQELDAKIRSAVKNYNSSFAQISYYGWRLREADGFKELGFNDEFTYMASVGVGKSMWYECMAVGQALSHLPLSELEKIPVGQLRLLLQIKPEIRATYDWANEAMLDDYRTLAAKITARNGSVPGPEKVPTDVLSVRLAATAKEPVIAKLKEFQHKHNLSSPGQALEFLVADKVQDENALGYLHQAVKLLQGVNRFLESKGLSEQQTWTELAIGRIKDAIGLLKEDQVALYEKEVHAPEEDEDDKENDEWSQ